MTLPIRRVVAMVVLAGAMFAPGAARAEVVFTADGVAGTSLLAKPPAPNAIDATSFAFTSAPGKPAAELSIVKKSDRASGAFMAAVASGQRFKTVSAFLVAPAGRGVVYRVTLSDAAVVSLKQSASDGDGAVTETITFDYARAEIEVFAPDPKTGATTSLGKTSLAGRR